MRVGFRPEARAEVLEARSWYEAHSPGLGLEFARAVDAALAAALRVSFKPTAESSLLRSNLAAGSGLGVGRHNRHLRGSYRGDTFAP